MIVINLGKAKSISHDKRRKARELEFAPYDEVISKQIPGKPASDAEDKRQQIRDKYAVIQTQIDSAQTVEELKNILDLLPNEQPTNRLVRP
jgi:hypothetical protein